MAKQPVVKAIKKAAEKVAEAVKEITQSVKPLLGDPFYWDDRAARTPPRPPGSARNPVNQPLIDWIDSEQAERRGGGWLGPKRRPGGWLG